MSHMSFKELQDKTVAYAMSEEGRGKIRSDSENSPFMTKYDSTLPCSSCGGATEHEHMLFSQYSGSLKCKSCGKSESFIHRIGNDLIKVGPMCSMSTTVTWDSIPKEEKEETK